VLKQQKALEHKKKKEAQEDVNLIEVKDPN